MWRQGPVATLRALICLPRRTRAELVAFQNERLQTLVRHAYGHVPYYRTLFDKHGIRVEDIHTTRDLSRIPITTRQHLQDLPLKDLVKEGINPDLLIPSRSSGSSGRPVTIRRSWFEERLHNAFRWRALLSYGLRFTDLHAYVMQIKPDRSQDNRMLHRLAEAMGVARYTIVDCFQSPEEIIRGMQSLRPKVVSGYASTLARIAQSVDRAHLKSLGLRFVGTGGEVLTPAMRRSIEEAFDAPVYDTYASIEFNVLAWQCRTSGGWHVTDDGIIMEILDGNRIVQSGQQGEVIATDLHSYTMPLIRYRLGDIVTKGEESCPCGQPFSTLQAIVGRQIDAFPLPDGRVIHPYQFQMTHIPWIREFQVTQQTTNHVRMRIVPTHTPSTEDISQLRQMAARLLGQDVTFELNLVSEISVDQSGKFRPFRSLVHSLYEEGPALREKDG
jgi:phenylacetate-coenzyme A ligase PaaK-like adenylate-forming protein